MSDLSPLRDPRNPFDERGLSKEVHALLDYLLAARRDTGVDVVVTCTTDHAVNSNAGKPSRHRQQGTGGLGLALDCRIGRIGNDIHHDVFALFLPVESKLHELIYADVEFNIKAGDRVPPYAKDDHHNHVHVAVSKGVFVEWPGATPEPSPLGDGLDPLLFFLLKDGHMFASKDDADAFLVCFAYTTLLGRPFGERESIDVLFMWVELLRRDGATMMWQEIANSEEARRFRARSAVPATGPRRMGGRGGGR